MALSAGSYVYHNCDIKKRIPMYVVLFFYLVRKEMDDTLVARQSLFIYFIFFNISFVLFIYLFILII